jgi:hypothetical protein
MACWRRYHASIKSRQTSPTGDERQNKRKSGLARPTASKRVSSPPGRDHPFGVGRHRHRDPNSKPHCDSDDRRARSDRELVRGRRRAYAPDATGRAEWRFCCWSGATVCNIAGATAFRRQSGSRFQFRIRADRRGAESRRPAPLGHETRCGEHPLAGGVGREPWSRPCRLRCRRFFDQRHVVIIRGREY